MSPSLSFPANDWSAIRTRANESTLNVCEGEIMSVEKASLEQRTGHNLKSK